MYKHLLSFYQPHKKLFFIDMLSVLCMSAIDVLFPMVVSFIVDVVVPQKDMTLLVLFALAGVFVYCLRYGFDYCVNYFGHVLGVRIEQGLRDTLFAHIQKLSFAYFDNTKTGNIISRLISDLNEISEFSHHGPEDFFLSVFLLAGSFVVMFMTNFYLALLVFLFVPLMLYSTIRNNARMKKSFMDVRKENANITSFVEDTFAGIRVVKAFANEEHEYARFLDCNARYSQKRIDSFKVMSRYSAGVYLYANLLNLLVVCAGGYLIYRNMMSVGVLVQFLLYVSIFVQPIKRLTTFVETFQKANAGLVRYHELLCTMPSIQDKKDAKAVGRLRGEIDFCDVFFSYADSESVLKDIDLHIGAGENIAIVGSSGAGKTTLCSLIPRFYDVSSGSVRIDGMDVRDMTQESLRLNIGIVQQDVYLFNATILENIAYGKTDATKEEIINAAKAANLHAFIMSLPAGYDTFVGERGVKLSGGQKQRVSIARIFLKNPAILILDEATSALDNENERLIQRALEKLSENRTTITIAHRLQTIESAERILVMDQERIVQSGTHEELLQNEDGVYYHLYNSRDFV